jgi:DNA-binding SARP family transcriptional activator/tetratricopeptide (TPR) repeat protein
MEARRYLRCLGQPGLFSPAGDPVRFRTKKHLALLVYLAVEDRQMHRRDRLAELFWPNVPSAEGRHSLATALSILRPRLGSECIEAGRDYVLLGRRSLALDLDRLISGDILGNETDTPLEIAGFLDGFDIHDSGEFGLWKDRQQARLLPRIMSAFGLLIDSARRHGDTRQVEHLANRMLGLDELCEEAVRAKMEVLALSGDRLSALKLYEGWRTKLEKELSATPSDHLAAMALQLRRRGWEGTLVNDIPTPPMDQRRGRAFIGRALEYHALYEAWENVRNHRRCHVMVSGDSGVGKTTLVERFTAAASLEGAIVSRVQCYDLEREIPYAAVAGLVVGLLDRHEVLGTSPAALAELSRIAPQVRHRFSSIPQPKDTHGDTARIELTESFHQLLEALAEDTPVILVVDDVHLADDASMAVLHLLVRRALDQRTMLVMIARSGELSSGSQSRRLRDMGSGLNIRELELQPLSDLESSELLTCLTSDLGFAPPLSVRKALLNAAAGYPLVLELLLQDWQANGGQSLGLAVDAMTEELDTRHGHSIAYHQFLTRIARTVDPATRGVIHLAAILGPRLNDLSMYSLANLSLGQTMAGLAQLTELRVLRDDSRGLEFVNELVRAHAYSSVPSSVRKALHGAIADRLLACEGPLARSSGLEIAWHCVRAGRPDQAIPHLIAGARQAMRHGASHVAERALESALPTLCQDSNPEVLLLLAEALQEQGRWRESLDRLSALPSAGPGEAHWRVVVLSALAKVNLGASLAEETRSQIPALTTIVRESSDSRARVTAARVLAHFASVDRDATTAKGLLLVVKAISTDGLDEDAQGQLALTRAMLLWLAGDTPGSYREVEETVRNLHGRGTENMVAVQLVTGLGTLRMHQGEYQEALPHYVRAAEMAARLGNDTQSAAVLGNLAICHGRLGDYREQLKMSLCAPRPWGADFGGFVEIQLTYCESLALIMLGRHTEAFEAVERLDRRLQGSFPLWMIQAWLLWKADLLLCAGRMTEAQVAGSRAIHDFAFQLQSPAFAGPFARWLAFLGRSGEKEDRAWASLQVLQSRSGSYDALDEVEVMCAALSLRPNGVEAANLAASISERLRLLPVEVANHLRRLGSLT